MLQIFILNLVEDQKMVSNIYALLKRTTFLIVKMAYKEGEIPGITILDYTRDPLNNLQTKFNSALILK